MNEKVDLTKILKDCPKGTKLYSTVCGEVEFDKIKEDRDFPIVCVTTGGSYGYVTADGRYCLDFDGECTLFPSKDQRDWSKFTAPWYKKPEPKFKVGDWLCANELNDYANLIKIVKIVDVFGKKRYKISRDYDSDLDLTEFDFIEKHYHLWNIQDAKDGDVLADEDNNIGIFQECEGMYWYSYTYLGCDGQLRGFSMGGSHEQTDTHPATKEQRDLLFRKIKEAGYKWNAETKTLDKLIKPKFKVGDKVAYRLWKNISTNGSKGIISKITDDRYIFTDGSYMFIIEQDSWDLVSNRFDRKTLDDEMIKTAILNHLKKMWGNCQDDICGVHVEDAINWLEKQKDKDKLIQELGEYKVKYTQEVLEKYINNMSNKDDERLRKTAIAFLKDFAEQGYENAVECIDWLEKQGEQASSQTNEELIIEWTIQDAKDGDILACNEEILLFKSYSALQGRISLYCWYNGHTNNFHSKEVIDMLLTTRNKICPATKEQRDALMKAMSDAGYEWDAEKKELKKLVEPKFKVGDKLVQDKFDPKTLQPFDKVLVKDGYSQCWRCNLFSHTETEYPMFPYTTHVGHFYYCIPYNDETKHLLGTNEEAPEYYRYWED